MRIEIKSVVYTLVLTLTYSILASQPTVVTIGTGTGTQVSPFGVQYGYERSAALYLQSEIGVTGNLATLGWDVGTPQTLLIPCRIYLKTTSQSSLSAETWDNMISGAKLVYDYESAFQITGYFTLNNRDFTLPDGSNLLVLCETNYGGTGVLLNQRPRFRFSTATNLHQRWFQDNNPPPGNGTVDSNRPNIRLTFIPKSTPQLPRHAAQWENARGAVIRYPLGLPYSMVIDLADDDELFCIVSSSQQALAIADFTANGVNLANVTWVIAESSSYWTRDWGPLSIYFGPPGSREYGIVDFFYNRTQRPLDNAVNSAISSALGIDMYTMDITFSGGNSLTDGMYNEFSVDVVLDENSAFTQTEMEQEFSSYLGTARYNYFPDPTNTYIKHIDVWAKLLGPDKVLIRRVPVLHPQYSAIEAAVAQWSALTSGLGTPYTIYRVDTPNDEPYTNSYILNDEVFIPFMGTTEDASALSVYQGAMPGYTVTGYLAGTAPAWIPTDAIHCRTNTIFDDIEEPPLPVELSSFTACINASNFVTLSWVTQSETNVAGFRIYRSSSEDLSEAEMLNVYIPGSNTPQMQSYVYQDTEIYEDGTYYYWLENQDMDGSSGIHGPVSIQVQLTFDPELPPIPVEKGINSIYPNPFSPAAFVKYGLQTRGEVSISVYNLKGQLVRNLVSRIDEPGYHTIQWDGKDNSGNSCTSGFYYITLRNGMEYFTRKALLLK